MKRTFVILVLIFISGQLFSQAIEFKFTSDQGIRVDCVAISHATIVNDTVFLFYSQQLFNGTYASRVGISTQSSDWLVFDTTHNYSEYSKYFIRYRMPSNVYRRYRPDSAGRRVISETSTDGINYGTDAGFRYYLPASDSVMGVGTYMTTQNNEVHLVYNTTGQDNVACRHAYAASGDDGNNFTYLGGNVFGDSLRAHGSTFVDPNATTDYEGNPSVFLMNQHGGPFPPAGRTGSIYSFTSTDNGATFTMDTDGSDSIRFRYDSFDGIAGFSELVYSLNDPKVVKLPDGRYRVYITAMLQDANQNNRWSIVSATASLLLSIEESPLNEETLIISPNPAVNTISCRASADVLFPAEYSILDINGKKVQAGILMSSEELINIESLYTGEYILNLTTNGNIRTTRKFIVTGK